MTESRLAWLATFRVVQLVGLGGLFYGLFLMLIAGAEPQQKVPDKVRAARTYPATGKLNLDEAKLNREAIENGLVNGGIVQLERGVYQLDRGLMLDERHSGCTLRGRGPGATRLINAFTPSPYIANCTFSTMPFPTGYNDPWDAVSGNSIHIPEAFTWVDFAYFRPGDVVWTFKWNGYWGGVPMPRARRVVQKVDVQSRSVTLEAPPPQDHNSLKWSRGCPIEDVSEGDTKVTLQSDETNLYTVGQWIYVTAGPSTAHEATGEYRKVVSVEGHDLNVERPLRRAYTGAAAVRGPFVSDVTVEDLTIGNPVNVASNPMVLKFLVNGRFKNVVGGLCNSGAAATCAYLDFDGCEFTSGTGFGLNTSHDVAFRNCKLGTFTAEEACMDITVVDSLVFAVRGIHGIQAGLFCERFQIRNSRIEGFGYPGSGGGNGSPFVMDGRDHVIQNVKVRYTNSTTGSFLSGDNFRIDNLDHDVGVYFINGKGWLITNSKARLWQWLRDGTTGTMYGSEGLRPEKVEGWSIDGRGVNQAESQKKGGGS